VVALKPEATPIIRHFGLTALPKSAEFPVYVGESINLIRSGVGHKASALATKYLADFLQEVKFSAWLNIGIAGHRSFEVGVGVAVNKIVDAKTGKTWYPSALVSKNWSNDTIMCVEYPELQYKQDASYDMESAGFYEMASKISLNELILCYKVISDNRDHSVKNISKESVSRLIHSHIPNIELLVRVLNERAQLIMDRNSSEILATPFFENWRFSVTQQYLLRNLLNQCAVLGYEISVNSADIKNCRNSRQVMQKIRDKLDSFWN